MISAEAGVQVGEGVCVFVGKKVAVGVIVFVEVGVWVAVGLGPKVGVGVWIGVGVGVGGISGSNSSAKIWFTFSETGLLILSTIACWRLTTC